MSWPELLTAAVAGIAGLAGGAAIATYVRGPAPKGRDAWDADRKATEKKP